MQHWAALAIVVLSGAVTSAAFGQSSPAPVDDLLAGRFRWRTTGPLVVPAERPGETCYSVKDPSIVRHEDRWHLFCTIRGQPRSHRIEYLSFADWDQTDDAERHVLTLSDGYFCAPQVFYFTPHEKWYLICQVSEPARKPELQPAFSTTENLADPASWTKPRLLFAEHPENVAMWIDFWIICDERRAHLFFTSLDGRMWRAETGLADFPTGWGRPEVVLQGDVFEASHTYRLKGPVERYLTVIEAQAGGRRYYKAYLANRLDGDWRPLADKFERPFAAAANVRFDGPRWADSFSHGELIRDGYDERMEVDPARLGFLFQGVTDAQMAGKAYGQIPWRLGLLEPAK